LFSFVLCTICCQFLWIVLFFFALHYLTFIYKMCLNVIFFNSFHIISLFYVQYLIPTIWWYGLSRRPLICVDAHDKLILKLLEVSVMICCPKSDSLII
jgi:hypothetical protein